MFLARLLLIFLALPALLFLIAALLPIEPRFWFLLTVFPLGLMLFATLRYAWEMRRNAGEEEQR